MEPKVFSNNQLADLTRWLKVICEPNRLMLLEQIIQGVQCNCELGSALQMAPNLISHHLGILRKSAWWMWSGIRRTAVGFTTRSTARPWMNSRQSLATS